ncbi:hypothetical protein [Caulobacter sp. Root343]|uniref:hypothetical protein n=1 Tax=Caulobacter sp. Root343 TaxID=1736520 RepID=UPI0006F88C78|nr:hypothetical protein [Caulobacter sp. Root343]KQV66625.1 hypothetical protein ASC70_12390 [Caulobacter sp. Root343]
MATITWSVEDFRTGKRWDGAAENVITAKYEAQMAIDATGRKALAGIKATVVRSPRTGAPTLWHARSIAQRFGPDKLTWDEVKADA